MRLRTFLDTAPRGAGAALARALQVDPVMITQWANGVKQTPVVRCMAIERATDGAVRRWDLCPDWAQHWPELIGTPGAPDPTPATQEARDAA